MDTLEARNLNRLRNGKMMLAFGKEKKSFGVALLLTLIGGWLGAHRFYLGHKNIGFAFLIALGLIVAGLSLGGGDPESPATLLAVTLQLCLTTVVLIEILLSFWVVGRENDRIKLRLSEDYGVEDLKVSQ